MTYRHLLDLVLPSECAGCLRPGHRWCARCERALTGLGFRAGPRWVTPRPCPPGLPDVVAWGLYAEPLRSVVTAWKDEGRRDLHAVLAPLLTSAVQAALEQFPEAAAAGSPAPLIVAAPSSSRARRVRGDRPLQELAARAARHAGLAAAVCPVLEQQRGVRDQSGLTTLDRRANVAGAFTVGARWREVVVGRTVLVVDDVMTTGATIAECSRALYEHGASVVLAATIAATRRRAGSASRFDSGAGADVSAFSRREPGVALPPARGAG